MVNRENYKAEGVGLVNAPPDPRPTNDISIEFEIRPVFEVFWFKMHSTITTKVSTRHDSVTLVTRDVCRISLWSI